jgi:hypothetical protein
VKGDQQVKRRLGLSNRDDKLGDWSRGEGDIHHQGMFEIKAMAGSQIGSARLG